MANLSDLPLSMRFENPHLAGTAVSLFSTGLHGDLSLFLAKSTPAEIGQFNGKLNPALSDMLPDLKENPLLLTETACQTMLKAVETGNHAISHAIDRLANALEADPDQGNVFTKVFNEQIGRALKNAPKDNYFDYTLSVVRNTVADRENLQMAWEEACKKIGIDPVDLSSRTTTQNRVETMAP